MGRYRVFETETFQRDLARLSRSSLTRLTDKLKSQVFPRFREEPHFGPNIKRLKHWEPPTWRYRVGAWRFFYEVDESERVVAMTAADHRGEADR